ncbi:unnamed protein product [Trichobilharzia regenti]|nr:unnamed protein product [Trichobilharzia regenti]
MSSYTQEFLIIPSITISVGTLIVCALWILIYYTKHVDECIGVLLEAGLSNLQWLPFRYITYPNMEYNEYYEQYIKWNLFYTNIVCIYECILNRRSLFYISKLAKAIYHFVKTTRKQWKEDIISVTDEGQFRIGITVSVNFFL